MIPRKEAPAKGGNSAGGPIAPAAGAGAVIGGCGGPEPVTAAAARSDSTSKLAKGETGIRDGVLVQVVCDGAELPEGLRVSTRDADAFFKAAGADYKDPSSMTVIAEQLAAAQDSASGATGVARRIAALLPGIPSFLSPLLAADGHTALIKLLARHRDDALAALACTEALQQLSARTSKVALMEPDEFFALGTIGRSLAIAACCVLKQHLGRPGSSPAVCAAVAELLALAVQHSAWRADVKAELTKPASIDTLLAALKRYPDNDSLCRGVVLAISGTFNPGCPPPAVAAAVAPAGIRLLMAAPTDGLEGESKQAFHLLADAALRSMEAFTPRQLADGGFIEAAVKVLHSTSRHFAGTEMHNDYMIHRLRSLDILLRVARDAPPRNLPRLVAAGAHTAALAVMRTYLGIAAAHAREEPIASKAIHICCSAVDVLMGAGSVSRQLMWQCIVESGSVHLVAQFFCEVMDVATTPGRSIYKMDTDSPVEQGIEILAVLVEVAAEGATPLSVADTAALSSTRLVRSLAQALSCFSKNDTVALRAPALLAHALEVLPGVVAAECAAAACTVEAAAAAGGAGAGAGTEAGTAAAPVASGASLFNNAAEAAQLSQTQLVARRCDTAREVLACGLGPSLCSTLRRHQKDPAVVEAVSRCISALSCSAAPSGEAVALVVAAADAGSGGDLPRALVTAAQQHELNPAAASAFEAALSALHHLASAGLAFALLAQSSSVISAGLCSVAARAAAVARRPTQSALTAVAHSRVNAELLHLMEAASSSQADFGRVMHLIDARSVSALQRSGEALLPELHRLGRRFAAATETRTAGAGTGGFGTAAVNDLNGAMMTFWSRLLDSGACEAALVALQRAPGDLEISRSACGLLVPLMFAKNESRLPCRELESAATLKRMEKALVVALQLHGDDDAVAGDACAIFTELPLCTGYDDSLKEGGKTVGSLELAFRSGVATAAVAALEAHGRNAPVAERIGKGVASVLRNHSKFAGNVAFASVDLGRTLARSLRACCHDAFAVHHLCSAMEECVAAAGRPDSHLRLLPLGGPEALAPVNAFVPALTAAIKEQREQLERLQPASRGDAHAAALAAGAAWDREARLAALIAEGNVGKLVTALSRVMAAAVRWGTSRERPRRAGSSRVYGLDEPGPVDRAQQARPALFTAPAVEVSVARELSEVLRCWQSLPMYAAAHAADVLAAFTLTPAAAGVLVCPGSGFVSFVAAFCPSMDSAAFSATDVPWAEDMSVMKRADLHCCLARIVQQVTAEPACRRSMMSRAITDALQRWMRTGLRRKAIAPGGTAAGASTASLFPGAPSLAGTSLSLSPGTESESESEAEQCIHAETRAAACAAVRNIGASAEFRRELHERGFHRLLVRLLLQPTGGSPELHSAEAESCQWAVWPAVGALFALASEPANCAALLATGGADGAIAAMAANVTDGRVAWAGCGLLLKLAAVDELREPLQLYHKAGNVLVQALRAHPSDVRVVRAACGALRHLAANAACRSSLQAQGVDHAVATLLAEHARGPVGHGAASSCGTGRAGLPIVAALQQAAAALQSHCGSGSSSK